jgi:hypothetical protein
MPDVIIRRSAKYFGCVDIMQNNLNLWVGKKERNLPAHDGEGHVMSPGGQLMTEKDTSWLKAAQ